MSNIVHEQQGRSALVDRVNRRWLRIAILSLLIVMVGGALAAFAQNAKGVTASHAMPADMSVVGPPTLSAATVNSIFANAGSPMAGTGALVEQTSRAMNIDDAFAMGVWWAETNDGMAGVGSSDRNPGSVRGNTGFPVASDGYTLYPSYSAAILDWFRLIQRGYVGQGLTTVYSISTTYVGTSGASNWAAKVISYAYNYRGQAPPPPVSTPTPQPTPMQRRISIPPSDQMHHPQQIKDPGQKNMVPAGPALPKHPLYTSGNPVPTQKVSSKDPAGVAMGLVISGGLFAALAIFLYGVWLERRTRRVSLVQAWAQSRVPFEGSPAVAPLQDGQLPTGTLQSPAFAVAESETRNVPGYPFTPLPVSEVRPVAPEMVTVAPSRPISGEGLLRRYKFVADHDA